MLSLDNLFAFYLVFRYYKLRDTEAQNKVLRWGIVGAVVLRALMVTPERLPLCPIEVCASQIGLCGAAVHVWRPLLIGCAVILVVSAVPVSTALMCVSAASASQSLLVGQLVLWGDDDDDDDDLSDNKMVRLAKAITPVSADYHGTDFFTGRNGSPCTGCGCEATPLVLVMVTVEMSDIVFAVRANSAGADQKTDICAQMDSVPAIFGITEDPMVVWAACMCAVMCLRSLYSLVVNIVSELELMSRAIGLVLLFIAGKIVADVGFQIDLPLWVTPAVVVGILGSGAIVSMAVAACRRSAQVQVHHDSDSVHKSLLDDDDDDGDDDVF